MSKKTLLFCAEKQPLDGFWMVGHDVHAYIFRLYQQVKGKTKCLQHFVNIAQ